MSGAGRRVLIPGGGGRLARALGGRLEALGWEVWAPTRQALDLTAPSAAAKIQGFAPDRLILAAAMTSVDGCEAAPERAWAINAAAVRRAAEALAPRGADPRGRGAGGCPLFYISTDYVFGRYGAPPFAEDDPPGPVNVYGRTKLAAEDITLAHGGRVARVAWLWGDGQGFPRWVAAEGRARKEVVVAEQRGTPTVVADAAAAIALALEAPPGVYHAVGASAATREAWARAILDRLGMESIPVRVCPVEQVFAGLAPRPADTSLRVTRPLAPAPRGWRQALAELDPQAIAQL